MGHLLSLKRRLSTITSFFDTSHRCVYIDYPLHTNVGDLLINLGSEQFFTEHGLHIWKRYNYYDFPRRIPGIGQDDVLLLHGGGNLGDIWFNFQGFREAILEQYPRNRIIFLPQTAHFRSPEREAASIRRMAAHGNLHVFARDHVSLECLKKGGLNCVSLMPDMAHSLAGVLKLGEEVATESELHLMRCDLEASPPPSELGTRNRPPIDWDHGTFSVSRRMLHRFIANTVKGVGRCGPPIDLHRLWYWHRDKMIGDGISLFARHKTVATNRLHGMLLGILLGRSVLAWDNGYGKLSAYYDSWLRGIPNLSFYRRLSSDDRHMHAQSEAASCPLS